MEYKKGLLTGIAVGAVFMICVWGISAAWLSPSPPSGGCRAEPQAIAEVQKFRPMLEAARQPAIANPNIDTAFMRYGEIQFLIERMVEDHPVYMQALGTAKEELESLRRKAGAILVAKMTWHLKKGRFFSQPFHCQIELGEEQYWDVLYLTDADAIAKAIKRIAEEADVGYDFTACRKAVVQYAAHEGPQLRERWIHEEKFGWGDAAGCLIYYLTTDGISPSVLGLNASETYKLLEMAVGTGS